MGEDAMVLDLNLLWKLLAGVASVVGVFRYVIYPVVRTVNVAYVSLTNHIPHITEDIKSQTDMLREQTELLKDISNKLG
jgi:hypothetical protein